MSGFVACIACLQLRYFVVAFDTVAVDQFRFCFHIFFFQDVYT